MDITLAPDSVGAQHTGPHAITRGKRDAIGAIFPQNK